MTKDSNLHQIHYVSYVYHNKLHQLIIVHINLILIEQLQQKLHQIQLIVFYFVMTHPLHRE